MSSGATNLVGRRSALSHWSRSQHTADFLKHSCVFPKMFPLLIDCVDNYLIDNVQDGNCTFCGALNQDQSRYI